MARLLDRSLGELVDAPGPDISPEAEAFVVRVAALAYEIALKASAGGLTGALAAPSTTSLMRELSELVRAHGSAGPEADALLRGEIQISGALERTGGLWRADAAQRALGVSRAALHDWRSSRKVLALPLADGSFGYPVAQFAPAPADIDHPRPYPGFPAVLEAAAELTPHELFVFLATPQAVLQGRTPFEALAAGESERVADLVAFLTTPDDAASETV